MFFSLLAASQTDASNAYTQINETVLALFNDYIIPIMMTCATIILVVFGIVNGVRLAKAQTEEEKTKAKKNIVGLGIGAIACVASIWLIPLILQLAFGVFNTNGGISPPNMAFGLVQMFGAALSCI